MDETLIYDPPINMGEVVKQARREATEARRRELIDYYKARYSSHRWWHRLFPFQITITRR